MLKGDVHAFHLAHGLNDKKLQLFSVVTLFSSTLVRKTAGLSSLSNSEGNNSNTKK